MSRVVGALVACATWFAGAIAAADDWDARSAQRGLRPFQAADLARMAEIGRFFGAPAAFSADGKQLAFTLVRPARTHTGFDRPYLWGNDRADVWVRGAHTRDAVNLTRGAKENSGWWAPAWSPDGRYLAMLSIRSSDAAGGTAIWLWDTHTSRLRELIPRGIAVHPHRRSFEWIDSTSLLCSFTPPGVTAAEVAPAFAARTAAEGWIKAFQGKGATASVIDAPGHPVTAPPQNKLARLDVLSGELSVVAKSMATDWRMSPDRKYVAYAVRNDEHVATTSEFAWPGSNRQLHSIEIARLDGKSRRSTGVWGRGVSLPSLRWAAGSRRFAFIVEEPSPVGRRFIVVGGVGRAERVHAVDLGVPGQRLGASAGMEWWGEKALVVNGLESESSASRLDWWLVSVDGKRSRNITQSMAEAPATLLPTPGATTFVGVAAGELWEIDPRRGVRNLTAELPEKIERIVWPSRRGAGRGDGYAEVLIEVIDDRTRTVHRLELGSSAMSPLASAEPSAEVIAYSAAAGQAIFHRSDRNGLRLWVSEPGNPGYAALVEANSFLRTTAQGELRPLRYTSLDGEHLQGWLILPVGHQPGARSPLLVWVYPGSVYGNTPPESGRLGSGTYALNMQIAASRGYAVLIPSVPVKNDSAAIDPMLRLQSGVMPAVDKVVELGIADPARLYLMGHSFGGFATYALISQTDRFAAAVALAGFTNPVSLYGQFDVITRYSSTSPGDLVLPPMLETGMVTMGAPPWRDLNRYLRNSPLLQVDRVRTPLMIIHGDLDYVPIQQAEEFFTALFRQGKEVRFVRYWGEGHHLQSPANVEDAWRRIFEWFDAHPAADRRSADQPRAHTSVLR